MVTVKKRLTKIERSKININPPLNDIIIGLLLGDGYLQCRNVNSRFIYGQSSLRQHHLNYFYLNHPNSIKIVVTDLELKTVTRYTSILSAARVLGLKGTTISNYLLRNQTL